MRPRPTLSLLLAPALLLPLTGCQRASSEVAGPSSPPSAAMTASARPPAPLIPGDPQLREMLGKSFAEQFPLDHVEEETKRFPDGSAKIASASDFLFVLGQGSGWHGFDTLKVEASGRAEITYGGERGDKWRHAVFQLSADELGGLRRELAAIDVFGLKRGYFALVDDGTQWFVRVRAGKLRKTVVLDNHFPEPIVRLAEHVRVKLLPPHQAEIDAGEELTSLGAHREPMRWEEDVPPAER